jgi:hypothetical protein
MNMVLRKLKRLFGRRGKIPVKCRSGLLIEMMWTHEAFDVVPEPGFRFTVVKGWKDGEGRAFMSVAMVERDSLDTGLVCTKTAGMVPVDCGLQPKKESEKKETT